MATVGELLVAREAEEREQDRWKEKTVAAESQHAT